MSKTANQTVQQWGNSLAIRIPAALARKVHFSVGQPVEVSIEDSTLVVRSKGPQKMSLEQRLAVFDPDVHGGEAMSSGPIGAEAF